MNAVTTYGEDAGAAPFSIVARRNSSLGPAGRLLAFALIFINTVGIAAAFAAVGAWLVLPFAGLEMAALYLAFRHVARHAGDYERIAIDGDCLRVESCEGGRSRRHDFNRCWARLVVDGGRVSLRSHGREIEIGRFVGAEHRGEIARELERELRGR